MSLDELRQHIDLIDDKLIQLLSQRAGIVLEVAAYKQQHDLPVHVPEREALIFARLREKNPGPLSGDAVERIYRVLVGEMRRFEGDHSAP